MLLSCAKGSGGRLCILGAGKCNDVDLEQLLETFSEIKDIMQRDPRLAECAGEAEQLEPWLWTGPFERTYLVYALRFERLSSGDSSTNSRR